MTDASDSKNRLDAKKALRLRVIRAVYDLSDGNPDNWLTGHDIALNVGSEWSEVEPALAYLEGEYLVEIQAMGPGGKWGITHGGVVEVEESIAQPDAPTEHFPPWSVVYVGGDMINSAIQASSPGSEIHQRFQTPEDAAVVRAFLAAVRENLDALTEGSGADRRNIEADLQSAEIQAQLDKPNQRVLQQTLTSLRAVAESATGSGALLGLIELARQLPL